MKRYLTIVNDVGRGTSSAISLPLNGELRHYIHLDDGPGVASNMFQLMAHVGRELAANTCLAHCVVSVGRICMSTRLIGRRRNARTRQVTRGWQRPRSNLPSAHHRPVRQPNTGERQCGANGNMADTPKPNDSSASQASESDDTGPSDTGDSQ